MDYFAVYWGGGNQTIQIKGLICFLFSIIIIFNSVYISTFNCYV